MSKSSPPHERRASSCPPRLDPTPRTFTPERVVPVWQLQQKRTRAVVRHEIEEAVAHRTHAAHDLDFDAYQHLAEQIRDLLAEQDRLRVARAP